MPSDDPLDRVFGALSNPTRRAILTRLAEGEATVLELAEPFAMSQPAISRHLKVLEEAGLLERGRDAQRRPCRLSPGPMNAIAAWLDTFGEPRQERFPRLDLLFEGLERLEAKLR